jgi:hypothetical protein
MRTQNVTVSAGVEQRFPGTTPQEIPCTFRQTGNTLQFTPPWASVSRH